MSRLFLIVVLLASVALYDAPRALSFFGPQAELLAPKLRAVLSTSVLPKLSRVFGG